MQALTSLDPLACVGALLTRPSVTPDDAGCQQLIGEWLAPRGFTLRSMPFGDVNNLWACRGEGKPLVIFAGHTDVVPPGDTDRWEHPPFSAMQSNDYIHARGAADMKGSIAAFLSALEAIEQQRGTLALLLTSDEEGPAVNGTARVVAQLKSEGVEADAIVIGEPTSRSRIADCLRIGRRGSLSARITLVGKGGHVAYPDQVRNPVHHAADAITRLVAHRWDAGDADFPPTSMQFTSLTSDSGVGNVVPDQIQLACNLRFSPATSVETIQRVFAETFAATGISPEIEWNLSARPFLGADGKLRRAAVKTITSQCGYAPELSTAGGTSDGRFLIDLSPELIELGPSNATIHQVNERLAIAELYKLRDIYADLFSRLLA